MNIEKILYLKLRLIMGFIFLWAFIDKLFGLGYATTKAKAWINGGSPTSGFLLNATQGPLEEVFKGLANIQLVDWLFMLGLLFVGATMILNRFVVWGAIAGSVMMLLMWLAVFPPENNPIVDEHIVYILVFSVIAIRSNSSLSKMRNWMYR